MAQEEIWDIVLTKPADKAYDKTPKNIRHRLDKCFKELEKNPRSGSHIMPLTGQLKGLYRARVGDWRVIYQIVSEKRTVEIIAILPRGDAYK